MALISTNFTDVTELTARFNRIFHEEYNQLADMVATFFYKISSDRINERYSSVGTYGNVPLFNGTVTYADLAQGFDSVITSLEFSGGLQIERLLLDTDQHNVIDSRPKTLAAGMKRTRQIEAARWANNAFSVDSRYNVHSEGVALCSNSHTTTSGASTTTGFDNLITGSLNLVNLATARIQSRGFRGDQAERLSIMPDTIVIPVDLCVEGFENIESPDRPDTANRAKNYNYGKYKIIEWEYLTDANNWFMVDQSFMKSPNGNIWIDAVDPEFAFVESFDEIVGKWRVYARMGHGHYDWRWVLGASVS